MGDGKYDPVTFAGYRLVAVSVADTGREANEPPEAVEPVEIGVTVFDGGEVGTTHTWLLRPSRPITPWALRAHGIGNLETAGAPVLAEVADQIRHAVADRIVVAVRVAHCQRILVGALPDWRAPRLVDLGRLAALVWPGCSQALGALEVHARVAVAGHLGRAAHDAPATARVFLAAARRANRPVDRVLDAATVTPAESVVTVDGPVQ